MPLAAWTQLGPHEILEAIGASARSLSKRYDRHTAAPPNRRSTARLRPDTGGPSREITDGYESGRERPMSPRVRTASPLPAMDAFLAASSLRAANSASARQPDSPFAGGRNRPGAGRATCPDSLRTAQGGQRDQIAALRLSPG